MPQQAVRTGVTLNYEITGDGDPLLLVMGTSGSIGLWGGTVAPLAERYRVIAFDNRGLGGSERGEGPITVASMAEDASALLDALEVPTAHAMGWSLGSAVVQEMALSRPDQVVMLPDLAAGCSMADMANLAKVERSRRELSKVLDFERDITPLTYINSAADLKAFCGELVDRVAAT